MNSLILLCFLAQVETGLDQLAAQDFAPLAGKQVAFLINHSAVNRHGVHLTELVKGKVNIKAFLAPEHGFKGLLDQAHIKDGTQANTGINIYSLYGKTRRPTPNMLVGVDLLVFDIQDIGARFYTYQCSLLYTMETCARLGIAVMVLDRPNPVGGLRVVGPMLDEDKKSFTGCFRMPVIHGMTMGELATMFQQQLFPNLTLTVVRCRNWERDQLFGDTGLPWVNPSPNIRSPQQALLYPSLALMEYTNISVGRGTDAPFERFGAPWLEAETFTQALNAQKLPGLTFNPHEFTPVSGPYAGEACGGVQVSLNNPSTFQPMLTAYTLFRLLHQFYPNQWRHQAYEKLLANEDSYQLLLSDTPIAQILQREATDRTAFKQQRHAVLLYKP